MQDRFLDVGRVLVRFEGATPEDMHRWIIVERAEILAAGGSPGTIDGDGLRSAEGSTV